MWKLKKKKNMVRVMVTSGDQSIFCHVKRGTRMMIGSGAYATFLKAGEPYTMKQVDKRMDEILKKSEKVKRKQKVFSLFRK